MRVERILRFCACVDGVVEPAVILHPLNFGRPINSFKLSSDGCKDATFSPRQGGYVQLRYLFRLDRRVGLQDHSAVCAALAGLKPQTLRDVQVRSNP